MRVLEIWRYPVKSMQGGRVHSADVQSQGLGGDRRYAFFDLETGFGLTARRRPELLFASAAVRPEGRVLIYGRAGRDQTAPRYSGAEFQILSRRPGRRGPSVRTDRAACRDGRVPSLGVAAWPDG